MRHCLNKKVFTPVVYVADELKYRTLYADGDQDVDVLQFSHYYPSTRTEPFIGEHIALAQQYPKDTYEPQEYGFFGGFLGIGRLEFRIEDIQGNRSEPFDLYIEVRQPPSPPADPPDELCDGAQPVITDANIYRESAPHEPIEATDGWINVGLNENLLWQIDYTDEDEDACLLYFYRYYPSDALTPTISSGHRVNQTAVETSYRHPEAGFFGDFAGGWRLDFQIEDEYLHRSEEFTLWVNVMWPN